MKRLMVGFSGFFYGLLLVAIYILIVSQYNWSPVDKLSGTCYVDECSLRTRALLFFDVFSPVLIFSILNIVAWNRWSARKWIRWAFGLTILVCCYWLFGYIVWNHQ